MTDRSDVELMLAAGAGDEGAFGELVSRHRDAIVNLTYRYLGNRADAEDLAQEVFLKAYRARKRYRPEAKFTTWLYRVAVNACLNEVRNRKHRPTHGAATLTSGDDEGGFIPVLADTAAESPADATLRSELAAYVRDAVDDLPERQRLALLLNKFHGLSYEELAESLDMTIPGIKSLLVRARENVRLRIEPYLKSGADRWSEKRGTG
ncbi:MAG: RNA polymerase sigma factor [Planctomycetota bacterium]|jgi:RNA polymerase sigma-70 factor (ECF subfamily)